MEIDGSARCQGGCFAQHHEDGFHADGSVGDVRGRETDRYEHIGGLVGFWGDGAVGDVVGPGDGYFYVAFVLDHTVDYVSAAVVRVHGVGSPADGIVGRFVLLAVVLCHNHAPYHSAAFAYVELRGEVSVARVLVFGVAPSAHFFPNEQGDAFVVADEVEQTFGVVEVLFEDLSALVVAGFGPVPVGADHVG